LRQAGIEPEQMVTEGSPLYSTRVHFSALCPLLIHGSMRRYHFHLLVH
jgi:hypothetical protein